MCVLPNTSYPGQVVSYPSYQLSNYPCQCVQPTLAIQSYQLYTTLNLAFLITMAERNDQCDICLIENIPANQAAILGPCDHKYCYSCLKQWIADRVYCPTCRTPIDKVTYHHVSETGDLTLINVYITRISLINRILSYLAAQVQ